MVAGAGYDPTARRLWAVAGCQPVLRYGRRPGLRSLPLQGISPLSRAYQAHPPTRADARKTGAATGSRTRWSRSATWHANRRVLAAWWSATESNRAVPACKASLRTQRAPHFVNMTCYRPLMTHSGARPRSSTGLTGRVKTKTPPEPGSGGACWHDAICVNGSIRTTPLTAHVIPPRGFRRRKARPGQRYRPQMVG